MVDDTGCSRLQSDVNALVFFNGGNSIFCILPDAIIAHVEPFLISFVTICALLVDVFEKVSIERVSQHEPLEIDIAAHLHIRAGVINDISLLVCIRSFAEPWNRTVEEVSDVHIQVCLQLL